MPRTLDVNYEGKPAYTICIERDFTRLGDGLETLGTEGRKALLVTDENVAPLYLEELSACLAAHFALVENLILPAGEESKNTRSVERIYEKAVESDFDRRDFFLALGGGVVGDMVGFAAATYMRGIRFLQLPTTLLAQVDSSIGGKTGVDFREYKNMVGAFHMPSLVYSSVSALSTLDPRQFASGMGEVIKHALIRRPAYFDYLLAHTEALKRRDPDVLEETVYQSNQIKREIVEQDPREQGERQLLNFGHTLGHAIESCSGFAYTHGQCVAYGCLAALSMAPALSETEHSGLLRLFSTVGLSTRLSPMDIAAVLRAAKKDKKMDGGQLRFILLRRLGEAYIERAVPEEAMARALRALMED